MTTTDGNGIIFLEETDSISPFHTLMNILQQGTSDAISAGKSLGGAKIQMGNASVGSGGTPKTLVTAPAFIKASTGFTRLSGGIRVPSSGIYLITAHQAISGVNSTTRAFTNITLSSAPPSGGVSPLTYRLPSYGEDTMSGSIITDLAANTTVGLQGYQASGTTRGFDGILTVVNLLPMPQGW